MILVSASVDRLLRLLQLSQSGEMAKYIPADMLEALMHIVYQGTVLAAEGRLPMHFRWHWKLFARTRFIVENRRRGLKFIQSGGAGGRQLVLVLRNFSQSEELLIVPAAGTPLTRGPFFGSMQAGHLDLRDIAELKRLLPASSDILFVQDLLALSRDYSELFAHLFVPKGAEANTACVLVPWAGWKQTVSCLIGLADCIVLYVGRASAGLLWEVEELIRAGVQHRSILLTRRSDLSLPRDWLEASPRFENLRGSQPDGDIQDRLQGRLTEFPHCFDLDRADWGASLAAVVGGSRADRSGRHSELEDAAAAGVLFGSLRDVYPAAITDAIVSVMEVYRASMEAASIADDPYELFTSANFVLGLSAAVSDFRVAAYASMCLSLAHAHYARPDVDRIIEAYKGNTLHVSERLSEMSSTYFSWVGDATISPGAFKESIRSRHAPA